MSYVRYELNIIFLLTALCRLPPHPSVEYNCLVTDGGVSGVRTCNEFEPSGTVVSPRCQTPNYYYPTALRFMHCIEGIWDYIAVCNPGLTKNGTNITILIKDSVEVHVSDLYYVVPINNSYVKPIPVPITNNDYTNSDNNNSKPNSSIINSIDKKISEIVKPVTSKPYDNSINIDSNNNQGNEASDTKSGERFHEIDAIDWKMGVPDNHSTKIPPNSYNKKKNEDINKTIPYIDENLYVNENNYANIQYQPLKPTTENNKDEEFDIDVRFSDSSIEVRTSGSDSFSGEHSATPSSPKKTAENTEAHLLYTTKNNSTNIYFDISNSSVSIHADGAIVFRN